jgi:hypothetical protein
MLVTIERVYPGLASGTEARSLQTVTRKIRGGHRAASWRQR